MQTALRARPVTSTRSARSQTTFFTTSTLVIQNLGGKTPRGVAPSATSFGIAAENRCRTILATRCRRGLHPFPLAATSGTISPNQFQRGTTSGDRSKNAPLQGLSNTAIMSVRSAPILRSWKLRRVGGLLACSLAVGSVLTVGICWMAAWDEYIPSPRGLAQGRFIYDADYLGIGKSGEGRPAPLQWWEALTPSSWRVGPRVWPEDKYKKRVAIPELSGEAKVEHLVHWQVIWRMGPGLTDSFSVEKR